MDGAEAHLQHFEHAASEDEGEAYDRDPGGAYGGFTEYHEGQYHQEHYRRNAFDQPVDEARDAVGYLVAVAAGHVSRKAQDRAERYGQQRDQHGASHTFGKELPAVFPDEGLVEVVDHPLEEAHLVLVLAFHDEYQVADVVPVGEDGVLGALLVDNDVHAEIVLAGDGARGDGIELHGPEVPLITVLGAEVHHELDVVSGNAVCGLKGEGLVSTFDGDDDCAACPGGRGHVFYLAGVGIPVLYPVIVEVIQPAGLFALGYEFLHLLIEGVLFFVVAYDDCEFALSGLFFKAHQFGVFVVLSIKADFLYEVSIDLVGFKGRDHVVGHLVVEPLFAVDLVLDLVFVKNACLYAYGLVVKIRDLGDAVFRLHLAAFFAVCKDGRGDHDCAYGQDQCHNDGKCFVCLFHLTDPPT